MAACRTVLPFSTVTGCPSIVSVTVSIAPDHIRPTGWREHRSGGWSRGTMERMPIEPCEPLPRRALMTWPQSSSPWGCCSRLPPSRAELGDGVEYCGHGHTTGRRPAACPYRIRASDTRGAGQERSAAGSTARRSSSGPRRGARRNARTFLRCVWLLPGGDGASARTDDAARSARQRCAFTAAEPAAARRQRGRDDERDAGRSRMSRSVLTGPISLVDLDEAHSDVFTVSELLAAGLRASGPSCSRPPSPRRRGARQPPRTSTLMPV